MLCAYLINFWLTFPRSKTNQHKYYLNVGNIIILYIRVYVYYILLSIEVNVNHIRTFSEISKGIKILDYIVL